MDWYEPEVAALERAARDGRRDDRPVAFYGSSSVRMWATLAADFPDLPVVNLGFGGSTLAACAHFFDRLVVPVAPRSVVLYAGDNDLGDGRTPDQVLGSFRALVGRLDAGLPAARLVWVSVKPSPARWHLRDRIQQTNRLVAADLAARPAAAVADVYPLMLGPDGTPRKDLYAPDGLHLSAAGYRVWKDALDRQRPAFA